MDTSNKHACGYVVGGVVFEGPELILLLSTVRVDQFFFRLCSDHLSVEAIPRKRVTVDLNKMKDVCLPDHELVMWTPQFVVLRNQKGQEVTLRRDGRMVIRKSQSELLAQLAAAEVMKLVLGDFTG